MFPLRALPAAPDPPPSAADNREERHEDLVAKQHPHPSPARLPQRADRASRRRQARRYRDSHQRRRRRLDGPALQRGGGDEQLRPRRRAQQDHAGGRPGLRRGGDRLLPRPRHAGSARSGADSGARPRRSFDARRVHVRCQILGRGLPQEAIAVLRPQGLRIRAAGPPHSVRRPRHRLHRSAEGLQRSGPDDRALHQGVQAVGRAGRGSDSRRLRDGQRDHPPREDQRS